MRVTIWRQDVDLRFALDAAHQRHDRRSRLFLQVQRDDVDGFGEVAPQPTALNGDPSLDEVVDELRDFVVPMLASIERREGALPSWTRVARFAGPRPASNTAVALVEMALADHELRRTNVAVSEVWPELYDTPSQATVSVLDESDEWHVDSHVARLRVKTSSSVPHGWALERLSRVTTPVLLDFNCSAQSDDDVVQQARIVGEVCDLVAIEQPYAAGNVVDHARLAGQLGLAISVDEGVRSLRDVAQLARYGAARMICVKPSRVGGLANARTIVAAAHEAGLKPYIGGFFESPFARRVNAQLARSCVLEPSDLDVVEIRDQAYDHETDPVADGFLWRPSAAMLGQCDVVLTA